MLVCDSNYNDAVLPLPVPLLAAVAAIRSPPGTPEPRPPEPGPKLPNAEE